MDEDANILGIGNVFVLALAELQLDKRLEFLKTNFHAK